MKIAFIGLGNMGGGMAANLVKAGHAVNAFDLSADALARAQETLKDKEHLSAAQLQLAEAKLRRALVRTSLGGK